MIINSQIHFHREECGLSFGGWSDGDGACSGVIAGGCGFMSFERRFYYVNTFRRATTAE